MQGLLLTVPTSSRFSVLCPKPLGQNPMASETNAVGVKTWVGHRVNKVLSKLSSQVLVVRNVSYWNYACET